MDGLVVGVDALHDADGADLDVGMCAYLLDRDAVTRLDLISARDLGRLLILHPAKTPVAARDKLVVVILAPAIGCSHHPMLRRRCRLRPFRPVFAGSLA